MVPLPLVSLKKRGRSQGSWGTWINEWEQRKQSQRGEVVKNWGHRERLSEKQRCRDVKE